MTLLTDIKALLISEGITTPAYIAQMPDDPDTCLGLFEYGGSPLNHTVEVEAPGLQIKVRQAAATDDYQVGRALAQSIIQKLHGKKNIKIDGTRYTHIYANQSPIPDQRDAHGRPAFFVNFTVKKDR